MKKSRALSHWPDGCEVLVGSAPSHGTPFVLTENSPFRHKLLHTRASIRYEVAGQMVLHLLVRWLGETPAQTASDVSGRNFPRMLQALVSHEVNWRRVEEETQTHKSNEM